MNPTISKSETLILIEKVSILIPVYNGAKTLHKCVNSAINQTYENVEIVIVVDGSPDNSYQIAIEMQNDYPYIKVINQENKGLARTRKIAFNESQGEYIYHLDQDDYLEPQTIKKLVDELENKKSDIVVCGCIYETLSGEYITKWVSKTDGDTQVGFLNSIFQSELQHNIWGKLIRRRIYSSVKTIEHTGGEDFLAIIMMICYNPSVKISVIPDLLHHYIVHKNSLTNTMPGAEFFGFTNEIEKILSETELELSVIKSWSYFRVVKCWRRYLRKGEKQLLDDKVFLGRFYKKYYQEIKDELSILEQLELTLYKYNYFLARQFSRVYSKIERLTSNK